MLRRTTIERVETNEEELNNIKYIQKMKKTTLLLAVLSAGMTLGVNGQTVKYVGTGNYVQETNWTPNQETNELRTQHTGYQDIITYMESTGSSGRYASLPNWVVDCIATPAEFKGLITRNGVPGTAVEALPPYAQVSQVFLTGSLAHQDKTLTGRTFNCIIFVQDFAGTTYTDAELKAPYQTALDALWASKNVVVSNYTESNGKRVGDPCGFDGTSVQDFLQSNFSMPYTYEGKSNILVSVNLQSVERLGFQYGTIPSLVKNATIFRGSGLYGEPDGNGGNKTTDLTPTIISETEYYNVPEELQGRNIGFPIPSNTLPAFGLKYFTNDIKGKVTLQDHGVKTDKDDAADELQPNGRPLVRLLDRSTETYLVPDGATALNSKNSAEVNADGSFSFTGLNPEHTYQLSVSSSSYGYLEYTTLNFVKGETAVKSADAAYDQHYEGKKNDIEVEIFLNKGTATAVADVAASKQVAGVDYYNMQGQRSNSAHEGVNVVVTRYTDGTKTTAKVVK